MKRLAVSIAMVLVAATASAGTPHVGISADVGAPDGASSSLVVRPLRVIELSGGIGYNMISTGYRAGISLVPLRGAFSPTLSLDYGHYADGDANTLAQLFNPTFSSTYLEHVGYGYANAHVGFVVGSARAKFYLRAGASRLTTDVQETHTVTTADMGDVTVASNSHVTVWTVSGRMGIVVYLR